MFQWVVKMPRLKKPKNDRPLARKRGGNLKGPVREARLLRVEQCMLSHFSERQIAAVMQAEFGITEQTTKKDIKIVYSRWVAEDAGINLTQRRAAAVRRVHEIGRKAAKDPRTLVQVERLLGEIEGTRRPEETNHRFSLDSEAREALALLAGQLGVDVETLDVAKPKKPASDEEE
jgi:hypothetical protein